MHKKNPKDFARDADGDSARGRLLVPPSLIGQGERTQPDWLYQFLLNPHPVRKMSVLRMPKFNMSKDDARALVNYFAAVERMHNPGIGLTFPYEDDPPARPGQRFVLAAQDDRLRGPAQGDAAAGAPRTRPASTRRSRS